MLSKNIKTRNSKLFKNFLQIENSYFLPMQLFKNSLTLWMKRMLKFIVSFWTYVGERKPNIKF